MGLKRGLLLSFMLLILIVVGCKSETSDKNEIKEETTQETAGSYDFVKPGLLNGEDKIHEIHTPFEATGQVINLGEKEVDLADNMTDDSIIIQQVINEASEGDELFFPTGTYNLKSSLVLKSKVNLKGEEGTIFKLHQTDGEYPSETLKLNGLNNLVISDINFTADFDGDYSEDTKNNNPSAGGPKYVVRIEDDEEKNPSYNITVTNVHIENYRVMGVRIATSHDVVVSNSVFEKATDLGGGGAGYGVSIQGEGNEISGLNQSNDTFYNVVTDCEFIGPYMRHGILIQYSAHNNLITNNTLTDTKLDAIDLHGEDEYLNEISYNTIENIITGAGIGVGNSGATHDKSGPGNYIHNNEINNAREGIKVHLGSENTLIEDNIITNTSIVNAMGIYLQKAPGTVIRNNTVSDSDGINYWGIVINEDPGYEGREAGAAENVLIENNSFSGLPGGIKITAGNQILAQNNNYTDILAVEVMDTRDYEYQTELIPSQVFSLLNWKINLPINNAMEIRQPALKTFEHEDFFYVNETNDGIVFNAPCQADETDATTANSKYPRSELREMAYGGMAEANWSTDNGTHIMTIDQVITHVPEVKSHVVVGQIHDADDDVVMIRLEDNYLFVEAEGVDVGVLDANYELGTRFQVEIKAQNDIIEVDYNGETMVTYEVHKEGCYFKAGMYTQSNVSKGDAPDAYGEAIIYDLKVSHEGIESTLTQTYENQEIPETKASQVLVTTLDTYIDLMKVDGIITPNTSPRNIDDKLMVKTSTGQTTIRLSFMEFDLSQISGDISAAELNFATKDVNGTSDVLVFGFEKSFGENLVWGDLYTEESQISKKNSEVMDYLDKFGKLTGEISVNPKDPDASVTEADMYSVNVSSFISQAKENVVTLVFVEPIGVDINMQLHSFESDETLAPTLSVWTDGTGTQEETTSDQSDKEESDNEETSTDSPSDMATEEAETDEGLNLSAVDVNEALDLLSYELLEFQGQRLNLPTTIGKDVNISWGSSDPSVIDNRGNIVSGTQGVDVTLTAVLSKDADVFQKEFILVVPSEELYPSYVDDLFAGDWNTPGMTQADGSIYILPEANVTTGNRLNVKDFGAQSGDITFDNTESFQAAIDAAQPGDEVYVPGGDYYFNSPSLFSNSYVAHLTLKSNVNFIGAGMDETVLISNFDENTNANYKTAVLLARQVSDMVISDLTITSNTSDDMLPDPDVSNLNNFVGTAPVYGIVVDNDKPTDIHGNVHIDNVLVEKYQRMGMRIRVVRDVQITNCVLQKATDLGGGGAGYGISIQGISNGSDLTGSNLDVLHNYVANCEIKGPYMRHGILLQYYAHNNLITNNTVSDTLLDAIDMHGEDEYSNEVSYNTVINTRRGAAIGLGNSGATHDLSGPNNYIHHNTIIGGDRGIDVLYGTPNTIISDNTISEIENLDGTGIFVQNGPGTIIGDNTISKMTGEESKGIEILYSYNALEPEKGIPRGIKVIGNTFKSLVYGYYIETYADDYVYEDNEYKLIATEEYVDGKSEFSLPPISDVVIPKTGTFLLPSDDNFITNESRDYVQSQANMKFKSSYYDVPYNRMIYMMFDLSETDLNKENIYLRLTGKSKDGLATINIFGSTTYTQWSENTITWSDALYHEDQVAKILDPNNELTHVTDFTFTTIGTEFNTYYIDVTDYVKNVDSKYMTFILVNDAVENMYCEIYSKETSQEEQRPGLILN